MFKLYINFIVNFESVNLVTLVLNKQLTLFYKKLVYKNI